MDPNPPVWVMFVPYDDAAASECLLLARCVRSWGIPAEVDGRALRMRKKVERAVAMECYYAIFVGPDDLAKGTVQARDIDESQFGKPKTDEVPLNVLDGWLAERLLGPRELQDATRRREQETDELNTAVTAAILAAELGNDPALWDAVAAIEARLTIVTKPGSAERAYAQRGVATAQATAARLRAG